MLNAFENLLLIFDMIDVFALDDVGLLHRLNGILVLRLTLYPANSYVTEGTYKHEFEILGSLKLKVLSCPIQSS